MSGFFPIGGCLFSKVRGTGSFRLSPDIAPPTENGACVLTQGAQIGGDARLYDMSTMGGRTYFYAFGAPAVDVSIQLDVLLGKTTSPSVVWKTLLDYLAANSPDKNPRGIMLSMPGNTAIRVLLAGFSVAPPDARFNIAKAVIMGKLIRPKSR